MRRKLSLLTILRKTRPHFHWQECASSPSDRAVSLYKAGGVQAVWDAVGAGKAAA
jgi:hypothetical protein